MCYLCHLKMKVHQKLLLPSLIFEMLVILELLENIGKTGDLM